jgi:hypothetical protein
MFLPRGGKCQNIVAAEPFTGQRTPSHVGD